MNNEQNIFEKFTKNKEKPNIKINKKIKEILMEEVNMSEPEPIKMSNAETIDFLIRVIKKKFDGESLTLYERERLIDARQHLDKLLELNDIQIDKSLKEKIIDFKDTLQIKLDAFKKKRKEHKKIRLREKLEELENE